MTRFLAVPIPITLVYIGSQLPQLLDPPKTDSWGVALPAAAAAQVGEVIASSPSGQSKGGRTKTVPWETSAPWEQLYCFG